MQYVLATVSPPSFLSSFLYPIFTSAPPPFIPFRKEKTTKRQQTKRTK